VTPFFELPEPSEQEKPAPRPPEPPWRSPPSGAVPGVVALELVIVANDKVAVVVSSLAAYPEGFEFELRTFGSPRFEHENPMLFEGPMGHRMRMRGMPIGPELLRFGFEFADGARATNLPSPGRTPPGPRSDGPPSPPVLTHRGGGGGGLNWNQKYWVWPLPPPGPLAFVCEWPAFDVPETRVEIDAQLVIDAAARSRRLFSDAPGGGASGSGLLRAVSHGVSGG
jgi:hypothetical protein